MTIFAPEKPTRQDVCVYLGMALGFVDTNNVGRLASCIANSRIVKDPQERLKWATFVSGVVEGILGDPDTNNLTDAVGLLSRTAIPQEWLAEGSHFAGPVR